MDRPVIRSYSAASNWQVAEEFIAGETLHGLSKRHDISRQLIRIWVGKFEAGSLDGADHRPAHAGHRERRLDHHHAAGQARLD